MQRAGYTHRMDEDQDAVEAVKRAVAEGHRVEVDDVPGGGVGGTWAAAEMVDKRATEVTDSGRFLLTIFGRDNEPVLLQQTVDGPTVLSLITAGAQDKRVLRRDSSGG